MTPDVYAAWLTAGDNLQPIGDWIAGHWTGLVALAVAFAALWVVWWAIRDDCRPRATASRQPYSDPAARETQPGSDEDDLLTCLQILHATDTARKEKPQP